MNEFGPLLKEDKEELNVSSTNPEDFERPALKEEVKEEHKIEEPVKIESPIDMSDFEEPALKKEEPVKLEPSIDAADFEEPALKKEQEHIETSTPEEETPEPALKEEDKMEIVKTSTEPQSVTLDELNNNGPKKVLTKTKSGLSKEVLTTYIFGAITLFFVIITAKSYYCGFKYYDTAHPETITQKVQTNQ